MTEATTPRERAARAIGDVERQFKHTYSWDRADEDWRDLCRLRADAVLREISEPSEAMVEAAQLALWRTEGDVRAAIRAAIAKAGE